MIAIAVAGYFLVGLTSVGIRVWFAGKHRVLHGGGRNSSCEHYACDLGFWPMLLPMALFWPIVVPVQLIYWGLGKLMMAPYLRSLPPAGSASNEQEVERELIDAALGLGSVEHFTGKSAYDEKWNRLDRAMKAMIDLRARQ